MDRNIAGGTFFATSIARVASACQRAAGSIRVILESDLVRRQVCPAKVAPAAERYCNFFCAILRIPALVDLESPAAKTSTKPSRIRGSHWANLRKSRYFRLIRFPSLLKLPLDGRSLGAHFSARAASAPCLRRPAGTEPPRSSPLRLRKRHWYGPTGTSPRIGGPAQAAGSEEAMSPPVSQVSPIGVF